MCTSMGNFSWLVVESCRAFHVSSSEPVCLKTRPKEREIENSLNTEYLSILPHWFLTKIIDTTNIVVHFTINTIL